MDTAYRIITISGLSCAGTSTLTDHVSKAIGWPSISLVSKLVREYLAERDLSLSAVDTVPDELHTTFDMKVKEQMQQASNMIFTGRTTGILAKDLPDVLKVFVTCALDERIRRYAIREQLSEAEAKTELEKRDGSDFARYVRLYGLDPRDTHTYNLVVDTTTVDEQQSLDMVLEAIAAKGETS